MEAGQAQVNVSDWIALAAVVIAAAGPSLAHLRAAAHRDGKLDAVLEQLATITADHEARLRKGGLLSAQGAHLRRGELRLPGDHRLHAGHPRRRRRGTAHDRDLVSRHHEAGNGDAGQDGEQQRRQHMPRDAHSASSRSISSLPSSVMRSARQIRRPRSNDTYQSGYREQNARSRTT
jgi:hypothetical protein